MLIYIIQGSELVGVALATLATMIIGMIWYSPSLFGNKWMKLEGINQENIPIEKKNGAQSYFFMALSALVMTYILGLFIKNLFVPSLIQSVIVGIGIWIGFIATTHSAECFFKLKSKPWSLYILTTGYYLVSLIASSVILFIFLK